jgi:hypothetical protein
MRFRIPFQLFVYEGGWISESVRCRAPNPDPSVDRPWGVLSENSKILHTAFMFITFDWLRPALRLKYLLTPWSKVLREKLTVSQLVKTDPMVHYRVYTSTPPVPVLSQISQVRVPHPTSWRYILILSSHQCLSLPSGLLPSGFPTKTLYAHLLSTILAKCPTHFILLYLITRIVCGEEYRPLISSLFSFLHSPVISFLSDPNILLNILFSNTLCIRSSLSMSDQVSHPYKTECKITEFLFSWPVPVSI